MKAHSTSQYSSRFWLAEMKQQRNISAEFALANQHIYFSSEYLNTLPPLDLATCTQFVGILMLM